MIANVMKVLNNEFYSSTVCSDSEFVGEVGDKIDSVVTLSRTSGYDTEWGWTYVYTFVDESGNEIVWRTHKEVEKGYCGPIKGKVKAHKTYKGVKQTSITNCKVAA